MKLKLGLLVADVPAPELLTENGDYVLMFNKLFQEACASYSSETKISVELIPFHVLNGVFPADEELDGFDAFVITGSRFSAYEDLPWINRLKNLVRTIINDHPKVFLVGICFGHQVIAEAMGGKVTKNPKGWEVGWTLINLNTDGKRLLQTQRSQIAIHQMHQDEVSTVPPNFQVLASTQQSSCQMMMLPGRSITIQSHPEFKSKYVKGLITMRLAKGIFTQQQHDQWMSVVDGELDGTWFGRKIIGCILGTEQLPTE